MARWLGNAPASKYLGHPRSAQQHLPAILAARTWRWHKKFFDPAPSSYLLSPSAKLISQPSVRSAILLSRAWLSPSRNPDAEDQTLRPTTQRPLTMSKETTSPSYRDTQTPRMLEDHSDTRADPRSIFYIPLIMMSSLIGLLGLLMGYGMVAWQLNYMMEIMRHMTEVIKIQSELLQAVFKTAAETCAEACIEHATP